MLKTMVFRGVTVGLLLLATSVHGAPVTLQLQGAAGDLQFPGFPLTEAEAQEISQKFGGEVTLKLVYDAAAMTDEGGNFRYVSPSGPALELIVKNATGTYTYSFTEYRLFLDDQLTVDQVVITPFLPPDGTVTLSSGRTVQVDIGLIWQDPSGTALTTSAAPPDILDLAKLNIRGYSFIFINDDGTGNGSVRGGLAPLVSGGGPVCGNGIVEGCEQCDDGNTINGDGCSATCQIEPPAATVGSLSDTRLTIARVPQKPTLRKFGLTSTFTQGQGSNGVSPLTETVELQIGAYAVTIPAGSFINANQGRFFFGGTINGGPLTVLITPAGSGRFRVEAAGTSSNLVGTTNPVTVGVKIGNDSATAATVVNNLP